MKPRVVYYDVLNYLPENISLLEKHFDLVRLASPDQDTPELLRSLEGILAPLKYRWGKDKIDSCPRLKVIASNTGGAPHVDGVYAASRGIKVLHLQRELEKMKITPTPELTWGLMLSLIRRIPWAMRAVHSGQWNRGAFAAPRMLSRMELGVVGFGRVGRRVARYGIAFGMTVRYYDPFVDPPADEPILRTAALEKLVAQSDIVSLHVMLNDQNRGLINKSVLEKFQRGSYLINTARGPLVVTEALLEALHTGRLAGAAVDVIPEEFDPDFTTNVSNHPLIVYSRTHDHLLITPHIAGSTRDAWHDCQERTIRLMMAAFNIK